ncbi:MAG TPA: hypothetical protein VGD26_13600 [Chitinophagaceae bacterium]
MLQVLTDYLIQYKTVSIPFVGQFNIRQQPAVLDFASRLIHPQHYLVEFAQDGVVSGQQIEYISRKVHSSPDEVSDTLNQFGRQLKERIQNGIFTWKGLGTMEYRNGHFLWISNVPNLLEPVPAHKTIHENAVHMVRRGEQEYSSDETTYLPDEGRKRSVLLMILWIIAAIAILVIIWHFYTQGFNVTSTGTRRRVLSSILN